MTQLAEVFALKRQGFNLRRGAGVLAVMLVPLIVPARRHDPGRPITVEDVLSFHLGFGAILITGPGRHAKAAPGTLPSAPDAWAGRARRR